MENVSGPLVRDAFAIALGVCAVVLAVAVFWHDVCADLRRQGDEQELLRRVVELEAWRDHHLRQFHGGPRGIPPTPRISPEIDPYGHTVQSPRPSSEAQTVLYMGDDGGEVEVMLLDYEATLMSAQDPPPAPPPRSYTRAFT